MSEKKEMVDHPAHYGGGDDVYEHIKVVEAWGLGYALGNATKYIARCGKKPGADSIEDLKKARWYIDHEIQRLERERDAGLTNIVFKDNLVYPMTPNGGHALVLQPHGELKDTWEEAGGMMKKEKPLLDPLPEEPKVPVPSIREQLCRATGCIALKAVGSDYCVAHQPKED